MQRTLIMNLRKKENSLKYFSFYLVQYKEVNMFVSKVNNVIKEINSIFYNNFSEKKKILELFCGEGSVFTHELSRDAKFCLGCDINSKFKERFESTVPNGIFYCADTIKELQKEKIPQYFNGEDYNIISVDNPLCIYGENYCEHFEVIDHIN
ncbi:TPA: RsmD family RNA methyltransferase, partial [Listeria monocytogenes]|nr:RsmD family RNA methyltransferase [Listeria monocytogenes]